VKNDAFNKVNGARRRRRHWSASRPRLSPSPNPSLKPKAEERQILASTHSFFADAQFDPFAPRQSHACSKRMPCRK